MENAVRQKIEELKKEKDAVILAHYYTEPEIQEIADFVGDSYYLAKKAKEINERTIVFCGVSFMGESAKILNPKKRVLMPDITADCPMAHMVKDGEIERLRKEYDDLAVVCYVNSVIELKTKSDVCVTSSNAVKIVKALPNKNVFFIPDENLGRYVKKRVPEKNIILNDGFCPRHKMMTAKQVQEVKALYPDAIVLAHPECQEEVLNLSDYIGSTAGIIDYAKNSKAKEFIICTEIGVLHRLQKDSPEKKFYFVTPAPICHDMKKNTPDKIIYVLQTGENEVKISEEDRLKALVPLDKMLELSK